jgi:hypothetical protein
VDWEAIILRTETVLEQRGSPQIVVVKLKVEVDPDYPFEEMLGSFSREPKSKFAVNHQRRQGRRDECEWFNPAWAESRADAERAYWEILPFLRDRKWMMHVCASAEVVVPCGTGSVTAKVGPCWADGFDNDDKLGEEEALAQVKEELASELRKLGFAQKRITWAMDEAEVEDG